MYAGCEPGEKAERDQSLTYRHITKANIGNEFYYRYSFDFWGCLLQLCALCILFLALCYGNTRELLLQNLQQLWQEVCAMLGIGG